MNGSVNFTRKQGPEYFEMIHKARQPNQTIYLIGCSNSKQLVPRLCAAKAEELYTGQRFRFSKTIAKKENKAFYILSAYYGVLFPRTLVSVYDCKMPTTANDKRMWSENVAEFLLKYCLKEGDKVIHLAGRDYWQGYIHKLDDAFIRQEFPLLGLSQGAALQKLKRYAVDKTQADFLEAI